MIEMTNMGHIGKPKKCDRYEIPNISLYRTILLIASFPLRQTLMRMF